MSSELSVEADDVRAKTVAHGQSARIVVRDVCADPWAWKNSGKTIPGAWAHRANRIWESDDGKTRSSGLALCPSRCLIQIPGGRQARQGPTPRARGAVKQRRPRPAEINGVHVCARARGPGSTTHLGGRRFWSDAAVPQHMTRDIYFEHASSVGASGSQSGQQAFPPCRPRRPHLPAGRGPPHADAGAGASLGPLQRPQRRDAESASGPPRAWACATSKNHGILGWPCDRCGRPLHRP